MKPNLIHACLALGLAAGVARAQQGPPLQRAMMPKPLSARPTGMASVSTSESGALHSREPLRSLPAFQATRLDGKKADIATFKQNKHWLLLYRRESCVPCDRMLTVLGGSENSLLKTGTGLVIVVAGNSTATGSNRLDTLRAAFPNFTAATWLEDTDGAALKALQPRGAPMLYALSGSHVEWSMAGLQDDPGTVEKRASAWVNSEDAQKSHPLQAASASPTSQP